MIEKVKRNVERYKKKMDGATYRELSREYNLAINTIVVIVKRYKLKEQLKLHG